MSAPYSEAERAKLLSFAEALKRLMREHDATLAGCGCCESPFGTVGATKFGNLSASADEVSLSQPYALSSEVKTNP